MDNCKHVLRITSAMLDTSIFNPQRWICADCGTTDSVYVSSVSESFTPDLRCHTFVNHARVVGLMVEWSKAHGCVCSRATRLLGVRSPFSVRIQ